MRLLLINPNTTDAITDIIRDRAVSVASPGTDIIAETAPFGASYITTPDEGAIAVAAMREIISEHGNEVDAVVICSSSDSGLRELRAEFDLPIAAMTESALHMGSMLGRSCCMMVYGNFGVEGMKRRAESYGMGWFVRRVRIPIRFDGGIPPDPDLFRHAMIEEGRRAVDDDDVDVIISSGSAAAHLTAELSREIGVHVLEGISCAVKAAEALVRLRRTGVGGG